MIFVYPKNIIKSSCSRFNIKEEKISAWYELMTKWMIMIYPLYYKLLYGACEVVIICNPSSRNFLMNMHMEYWSNGIWNFNSCIDFFENRNKIILFCDSGKSAMSTTYFNCLPWEKVVGISIVSSVCIPFFR